MTVVTNLDAAIAMAYRTLQGNKGFEYATSIVSFTRTGDTSQYTAGDVISDANGARALQFPACGKGGAIINAVVTVAETNTIDLDLLLFDQEPTNHADNAALACATADQAKCIGVLRFFNAAKVNIKANIEVYRAVSSGTDQGLPPIPYVTQDGTDRLFGLLVTRSTYTPISAAKFTIRLGLMRSVG